MLACVWASIRRRGHSVTSILKRMNLIHAYFRCKQERRPFPKILTFKTRSMQNRTCRHWVLLTVRITRIFCTHPRLEKRQLKLFFRHRACRTLVSTVLYPFSDPMLTWDKRNKLEPICVPQLFLGWLPGNGLSAISYFFPDSNNSPRNLCEGLLQFPFRFLSGEFITFSLTSYIVITPRLEGV